MRGLALGKHVAAFAAPLLTEGIHSDETQSCCAPGGLPGETDNADKHSCTDSPNMQHSPNVGVQFN